VQQEDGTSTDESELLTVKKKEVGTQTVEEIWVIPLNSPLEFVEDHLILLSLRPLVQREVQLQA